MLEVRGLSASYGPRPILQHVTMAASAGQAVAIMGPSGSGKTTLLRCLSGLEPVPAQTVFIGGTDIGSRTRRERARMRRSVIGQVFQFGELLDELTVEENVGLPFLLAGQRPDRSRVREVLAQVGLDDLRKARPAQLSGGEVQRAAFGRAIVTRPPVLLCDEPTGALDEQQTQVVVRLLLDITRAEGAATVVVTHDRWVAQSMDHVLVLQHGALIGASR